ncbi:hypothetical protein [Azotosporobacter soli]|uniref:hypothetical protein n=1 Tax=Azotosporobacter soli TaxID=3055040 RepID=UPI0031FE8E18
MKKNVTDIRNLPGGEEEVVIVIRNGCVVHFSQRKVEKNAAEWWKEECLSVSAPLLQRTAEAAR